MRTPRFFVALVAASLLAALPVTALGVSCTRPAAVENHYVKMELTTGAGVYVRGVSGSAFDVEPYVVSGYTTAGVWIDSTANGGSAWIGMRDTSGGGGGPATGYLYARDANGNNDIGPVSFALPPPVFSGGGNYTHDFKIHMTGSGQITLYYEGVIKGQGTPSPAWASQQGTIGATAGIANKGSQMWGTQTQYFTLHALKYSTQYGTGVTFPGSAVVTTSQPAWFSPLDQGDEVWMLDNYCF